MRPKRITMMLAGGALSWSLALVAGAASPAATVGGTSIAITEVEAGLRIPLYELEVERYRLTRRKLEQVVAERLLQAAATQRNMSVSAYVTAEIQDQMAVTPAEVEARYRQSRPASVAPEEMSEERAKQDIKLVLIRERAGLALQRLLERLSREANVSIDLRPPEPPRIELTAGNDPALGPERAPVTVVEFADFECPVCKESVPALKELRRLYPEQVRFVYRDFPLAAHPQARPAAEAAQCAHEQGQFWAYHDALFGQAPELSAPAYVKIAERVQLNTEDFAACLRSGRAAAAVAKDAMEAQRIGLTGTPTFFINGRYLGGLQSLDALRDAVEKELASALNGGALRQGERER